MSATDIIDQGLQKGWNVIDAARLEADTTLEADVVVIGTGAGGGTTAEILAQAGLRVIMVEEGRLYHQKHFTMDEHWSYSRLYQEGLSRVTEDGGIAILQGRCVGGSTTVNWTSSFRTPDQTLEHWQRHFGVRDCAPASLAPWFEDRERRQSIATWQADPNPNNGVLKDGCERLGWHWQAIPRNVKACWNLGYCGFGCPTNAKQGMLTTTVPGTLDHGGQLIHSLRAEKLIHSGDRVRHLEAIALDDEALHPTGKRVRIQARHFVVAASAIGTPALLLRSEVPDPHGRIGKRTFLHPVNATVAEMPEKVEPYYGAPQSIYSDQFVWHDGVGGSAGFKLEVPPLQPGMAAGVLSTHGQDLSQDMARFPYMNSVIALLRDGFHDDSPGGTVSLRSDGSPVLDYPISDYLWQGFREAYLRMAEIQFAAGARWVKLVHMDSPAFTRWPEAKRQIATMPMALHRARLFSAHQMGGCAMGEDRARAVVDSYGRHHHLNNLSVHDASVFPTSIGANPQLSIYALSARNAVRLARDLNGSQARRAEDGAGMTYS